MGNCVNIYNTRSKLGVICRLYWAHEIKKLSLWISWRHFGEVEVFLNAFLNSALNDDEWSASGPRPPYAGESAPCTHFLRRAERNHNSVCWLTILHPISIFVQLFQAWNFVGGTRGGGRIWRHYSLSMGHSMDFVQRKPSHTTYIIFNSKTVIQNTLTLPVL